MRPIYEYVGEVVTRKLRDPRRHTRVQVIRFLYRRVIRRSYWAVEATSRSA